MATYVISDIHGQYDMFMELLEKIPLKDSAKGFGYPLYFRRCGRQRPASDQNASEAKGNAKCNLYGRQP